MWITQGTPWWSSGQDELSLPRAQVQSLVGELRCQRQWGMGKADEQLDTVRV